MLADHGDGQAAYICMYLAIYGNTFINGTFYHPCDRPSVLATGSRALFIFIERETICTQTDEHVQECLR